MSESLPRLTRFADGITAVDTEYVRPQMDASHIVVVGSRAAIVDTGPNTAVPLILAALDELGIERDAVDYLFLTHVHLDHAGGAGALMGALPNATAVVHPRGAPHMIDPAKLIAGTRAVYGDELYSSYTAKSCRLRASASPSRRTARSSSSPGALSSACTRPGTPCITWPSSITARPASSPAIPSGCPTANSTRRKGPGSCPPPRPRSSIPVSSRGPSSGSCSSARVGSISRTTAKWSSAHGWPTTCMKPSTTTCASRAAPVSTTARMRFELRDWAHSSLRDHGCKLDIDTIDSILNKDFELNAAGLAAWLKREAN